jgi:hypothetical protein
MMNVNSIDLQFLIDYSKSMELWINEIRKFLIYVLNEFKESYRSIILRVSIILFRENPIIEEENIIKLSFTTDMNLIQNVLNTQTVLRNSDTPENLA